MLQHIIRLLFLPALVLLASCNQADITTGTRLPDGKYPLQLTAGGLQVVASQAAPPAVAPRGTTDNDWLGVTTVAIQVDGEVKEYAVSSASNTTATLSSTDPFYWQTSDETKTITAWHPADANPADWKVQADQRTKTDYEASDLIQGTLSLKFSDKDNPTLNQIPFTHQTAKVRVLLTPSEDVTLDHSTAVQLLNIDGVSTGNTVTSYCPNIQERTYLALITGQTIAPDRFIKVSVAGTDFHYTPPSAITLLPGHVYTYHITVKPDAIEVTSTTSGTWTTGGDMDITSKEVVKRYTAEELKPGDYFYRDAEGNRAVSDGGLRKLYADGTVGWTDEQPLPDADKGTCIGIVLKVGRDTEGNWADNCDYKLKGSTTPMPEVHGYVLALRDANGDSQCQWGSYETSVGCDRNTTTGFNGYSSTQTIVAFNNAQGGILQDAFPAAYHATNYETVCPAPANTSGWFLPSGGQCQYWLNHRDVILRSIQNAGGDGYDFDYWSSSESSTYPATNAGRLNMGIGEMHNYYKDTDSAVRPVLAF